MSPVTPSHFRLPPADVRTVKVPTCQQGLFGSLAVIVQRSLIVLDVVRLARSEFPGERDGPAAVPSGIYDLRSLRYVYWSKGDSTLTGMHVNEGECWKLVTQSLFVARLPPLASDTLLCDS